MSALPPRPNLDQLKRQARELLEAYRSGEAHALARIRAHHPGHSAASDAQIAQGPFSLRDAQLVIAREHRFQNWARLKHHIEVGKQNLQTLIDAVRMQRADEVRALLREDRSLVEHLDAPHWSFAAPAVVAAAEHGHHGGMDRRTAASVRELIDILVDAGADLDARSEWWAGSWGVLHRAPREIAQHLIGRGARLDVHSAARLDLLDQLRELLREDPARVNARGPDGMLPLHFAATPAIARLLIESGADLDTCDLDHHGTPAQHALSERDDVCRELLAHGATPDLFMACHLGDVSLARAVLDRDPAALDAGGGRRAYAVPGGHIYIYHPQIRYTGRPLSLAARRDEPALHALLLERCAPRHRLIFAIARHDRALIDETLREHPQLVRSLPPEDMCMLSDAAWDNDLDAVRLMLEIGFDVDARGVHDATALDRAAFRGHAELVKMLLEHRPSLSVLNEFGGTPLRACTVGSTQARSPGSDHVAAAELLIAAGSKLPDTITGSEGVQAVLRRHGVGSAGS